MEDKNSDSLSLDKTLKARLIVDMLTRIVVHYGFWFTEVRHQMGMDKALEVLEKATGKSVSIGLKRFSDVLGFELEDGLPKALVEMEEEKLETLIGAVAKNWLVNDGVWFQAVEFDNGMNDAKRCNDSCWAQFSPYEAFAIKKFLKLDDQCGLEGLKKALSKHKRNLSVVYTVGNNRIEGGEKAGKMWSSEEKRPEAVFCSNDMLAMGFIQYLVRSGVQIPDDVAVLGHDDVLFADRFIVPLSTVVFPKYEMGQYAINLLLDRISNPTYSHEPQTISLEPELVLRKSCI